MEQQRKLVAYFKVVDGIYKLSIDMHTGTSIRRLGVYNVWRIIVGQRKNKTKLAYLIWVSSSLVKAELEAERREAVAGNAMRYNPVSLM